MKNTNNLCFKNVVTFLILFLMVSFTFAQTPQYYNFNTGTSANSFPFNMSAGKAVNTLFLPGAFN